jgi:hypothetical protein
MTYAFTKTTVSIASRTALCKTGNGPFLYNMSDPFKESRDRERGRLTRAFHVDGKAHGRYPGSALNARSNTITVVYLGSKAFICRVSCDNLKACSPLMQGDEKSSACSSNLGERASEGMASWPKHVTRALLL